jgi:transmembrane sensor
MNNQRLSYLFELQLSKKATDEQKQELTALLAAPENEAQAHALLYEAWESFEPGKVEFNPEKSKQMLNAVLLKEYTITKHLSKKISPFMKYVAAAVLLIALSSILYFGIIGRHQPLGRLSAELEKNDIAPGGNKAILALVNGRRINLSNTKSGVIIGASRLRYNDGTDLSGLPVPAESAINHENTMITPAGGQYQVILPDGTKVWLNAVSSLKFPTTFANLKERTVQLTGEAYFEVSKDKAHPFIVKTALQNVRVLGTHFNISSYSDEPATVTTLIEGSVSVRHAGGNTHQGAVVIKPGQQSSILSGRKIDVKEADLESVMAWKNGDFIFEQDNLSAAMRKIARWYNVDVIYDPSVPTGLVLGGWVSRSKNISAILEIMESTGKVHFKIEGRRVIVTK